MSLFSNSSEPEKVPSKSVKPIVLRTDNVARELVTAASAAGVPVSTLDFNLLSIQTMVGTAPAEHEPEWEELSADEIAHLDQERLLNPEFRIKQLYEVEIFSKTEHEPLDTLELSVGANPLLTKVYLTIKPGSKADYFDGFNSALLKLVNKKKLRANLMINIFDAAMRPALSKLSAQVQVNGSMTFEEKEVILIGQAVDAVPTKNDRIVIHCDAKKNQQADERARVDHSKRGYMLSVAEGDLLIEYFKPLIGEPGRNCRGEYITPPEPSVTNAPTFTVTDKIETIDSDDKIEYRAKQSGYVSFEKGVYDIRTEIEVTEISFKTTGSIDTSLDADVSINVKSSNSFEDAIGEGMVVEVNEINVDGNMGPSSVIRAKRATVSGQTHQSAEIYADELRIDTHRGKAQGKNVSITRLEHGIVEGDRVTITHAVGGTVRARDVSIEILGAHSTIMASHRIEIGQLRGEENRLIIDPIAIVGRGEALDENEAKLKEAKRHLAEVENEVAKYEKMIHDNANAYADLKKRLQNYKSSGVAMPPSFVSKYKQFQEMQTHFESLKKELEQKRDRHQLLSTRHQDFQSDIFEARIVCKDTWHGYNEVRFHLVEPHTELIFVPPEGGKDHAYCLRRDDETGLLFIVAVEE